MEIEHCWHYLSLFFFFLKGPSPDPDRVQRTYSMTGETVTLYHDGKENVFPVKITGE